jgi:hypothetical protein
LSLCDFYSVEVTFVFLCAAIHRLRTESKLRALLDVERIIKRRVVDIISIKVAAPIDLSLIRARIANGWSVDFFLFGTLCAHRSFNKPYVVVCCRRRRSGRAK